MSYVQTFEEFFAIATWLDENDEPAKQLLLGCAESLDKDFHPPIAAQARMLYNGLMDKKPEGKNTEGSLADKILDSRGH